MKNMYEKYLSDENLIKRRICRCKIANRIALVLWLGNLIVLTFFSEQINMTNTHELILFVGLTMFWIGTVIQLEVLYVIDLIKNKTQLK